MDKPERPPKKKPHVEPKQRRPPRPTKKGTTARTTAAAKYLRDQGIVNDHLLGLSMEAISKKHKVSVSQCYAICADWRNFVRLISVVDPMEHVEWRVAQYDAIFRALAELAHHGDTTIEAKVSAMRGQLTAMHDADMLLMRAGMIPNDMGKLTVEVDFRFIGSVVARILDEEDVPLKVFERIAKELRAAEPATNGSG